MTIDTIKTPSAPSSNSNGAEKEPNPPAGQQSVDKQSAGVALPSAEQLKQNDRQVMGLVTYYTVLLLVLFWFFLDVWSNNFVSLRWFVTAAALKQPLLRMMGFMTTGGALGSILYSIRTLFRHYIKNKYDPRWLGKYVTAPIEGAVLAVIVMALLQGGIALLGLPNGMQVNGMNHFALFGISALIGYSVRAVIAWMERVTASIFGDTGGTPKNDDQKNGGKIGNENKGA